MIWLRQDELRLLGRGQSDAIAIRFINERLRTDMGIVVRFPGHYFSRDFSFKVCERCDGIADGLTTHCPGVILPPLVGCNVATGLLDYDERCGGWHRRMPWQSRRPLQ